MNLTGADRDFLTAMIAHHAEAVEMARELPEGGDSAVADLAAAVITAQAKEIQTMGDWLNT